MNIGETARRAGVTVKTLRYYEALELVRPVRRANGYRDYSDDDVRLVAEIRSLGGLGIPADRTRPFLDCLAAGRANADDCPASLAGYREAIDDVTDRIEALAARRVALIRRLRDAAYRNSRVTPDDKGGTVNDLTRLPADLPVPQDDSAADHLAGLPVPGSSCRARPAARWRWTPWGPAGPSSTSTRSPGRPDRDLPDGWNAIPGARGCTAQACDFRDHSADLTDAGAAQVFGVSSQDTDYQQEVSQRLRLPFPMLSDVPLMRG